jgi:hypothetical protein
MIRDRRGEAAQIVADAEGSPGDEDLPATRMAREVLRLRGLLNEQARTLERMDQLESENKAFRRGVGLSDVDDRPTLLARLAKATAAEAEMFKFYGLAFERVRELENARREALMTIVTNYVGRPGEKLIAISNALKSVPDCGMCRDKPPEGGCQRCRRGVKP